MKEKGNLPQSSGPPRFTLEELTLGRRPGPVASVLELSLMSLLITSATIVHTFRIYPFSTCWVPDRCPLNTRHESEQNKICRPGVYIPIGT